MFSQQKKVRLRNLAFLTALVLGSVGLTACKQRQSSQTYSYSKSENDVYNCVNKFSGEIPKGFVRREKEMKLGSEISCYHDLSLVVEETPMGGKGRFVINELSLGLRELNAGYLNAEDLKLWLESKRKDTSKLKRHSFFSFEIRSPTGEHRDYDTEVIVLAKSNQAVVYLRKVGSGWRRCEIHDIPVPTYSYSLFKEATQRAEGVPKEQVQRYLDLAERFNKTYGFKKSENFADMAKARIKIIETAIDRFYIHCGRYPDDSEGLEVLLKPPVDLEKKWGGPYLKRSYLLDPWKNPYIYIKEGEVNPGSYDLISFGADGKQGGEAWNEDIYNN